MNVLDLLKGKKAKVMTNAKVEVELEILFAKENRHSEDLEPSTRENDWWPKSKDWTTIDVEFTNGFRKTYQSISEIEVI